MGKIICCHKCVERQVGCHAKCKSYGDEKAALEIKNQIIFAAKTKYHDLMMTERKMALKKLM